MERPFYFLPIHCTYIFATDMHTFPELIKLFGERFQSFRFPASPENLYAPNDYFMSIGGKRIRPVLCLLGNQLYGSIKEDTFQVASAIELFHNFTLVHDDIMDKADLRRGKETMHKKYGQNTAILSGDVMMIKAYELLSTINPTHLPAILQLFNKTAREVCEGQQLDMDFESRENVAMEEYLEMIGLKTSVLIAASLEMGAILQDASLEDRELLYEFGLNLGIAFQIQDDYLDAFGDPEKFGKTVGGDITQNKKTFLLIYALEHANEADKAALNKLLQIDTSDKVESAKTIYRNCNADTWTKELIQKYLSKAMLSLEKLPIDNDRKAPLKELAAYLIQREN